jgi:hypothetical protein
MEKTAMQSGVLGKQNGGVVKVTRVREELDIEGRTVIHESDRWSKEISGQFRETIEYKWLGTKQCSVDLITTYKIEDGTDEMIITFVFVDGKTSVEGAKNIKMTRIPDAIIAVAERYEKRERVRDDVWGKPLIVQSLEKARNRLEQEKQKQLVRMK